MRFIIVRYGHPLCGVLGDGPFYFFMVSLHATRSYLVAPNYEPTELMVGTLNITKSAALKLKPNCKHDIVDLIYHTVPCLHQILYYTIDHIC